MTEAEFKILFLSTICAEWPTTAKSVAGRYFEMLGAYSIEIVREAVNELAAEDADAKHPRPPSPTRLAQACHRLARDAKRRERPGKVPAPAKKPPPKPDFPDTAEGAFRSTLWDEVGGQRYETWFAAAQITIEDEVTILVANLFICDYIKAHFRGALKKAAEGKRGRVTYADLR